jgi:hypothetical protein
VSPGPAPTSGRMQRERAEGIGGEDGLGRERGCQIEVIFSSPNLC